MGVHSLISAFGRAFRILVQPKEEFKQLEKVTLEQAVSFYIRVLVSMAFIAAAISIIYWFFRTLFYDIFLSVSVDYPRMMNYALGTASSVLFFYLYAGTFLLFVLSIFLKPFVKKKYSDLMKILMYASMPLLLFGWIPPLPLPFLGWSIFLIYAGMTCYHPETIQKTSIKNRD